VPSEARLEVAERLPAGLGLELSEEQSSHLEFQRIVMSIRFVPINLSETFELRLRNDG
jgi:hypothetical protein